MKNRIFSAIIILLTTLHTTQAAVKLPAIISDNMVLQQQSQVSLWGWAVAGKTIKVTPSWQTKEVTATADASGKFTISVKTPKAGGPYSISFSDGELVTVNNVLIGEVWLASGQSNMEFPLGKGEAKWRTGVYNSEQELAMANHPNIRMIDVENTVADSVQEDIKGKWEVCTPQTAIDFSAVGYYFARAIQDAKNVPVGIINSTWGGTPAESWTKKSVLENDADFQPILVRYDSMCAAHPAAMKEYEQKLAAWNADTSKDKKGAPKEPLGPKHNKSPYKLYNGMIAPIISYKIKGVIWYQGESNAIYGYQYRRLFPAMIESWRTDFKNPELPFYFVQITPHKGQNPVIRESQLLSYRNTKHTGIVVTTDVGDSLDIHPRDKKTVGARLSRWALKNEYGQTTTTSGPLYRSLNIHGNKATISFDFASGLCAPYGSIKELEIAGADQKFYPAQALIKNNQLVVWSNEVVKPVAVRYGWLNVPHAEIYNGAGLPASPFRTDDWQVETQGKN